ncbi:hypothetical protein BZA05DRAFT_453151 [Tricharina praecox]|uniref:uncharacterized protein n=1 Tax=Tricharina praecox TaxID=43433 RepID=UPI00221EBC1B|nr:uncharacterized protein BZA05DRAFT_453151 [Tricharina praecox]KAI5851970.1 hypothetical protein BZA05DRAFT_453151 [Tricharina praecox]
MSSTSPSRAPDKNEGVHQANASDPTSIGSAPPAVAPTGSSAHTDGRRPEITRCSNSAKHPRWKCNVCNYHFNPNQQEAHLASNAHLSRVAENDRRIEATQRRLEEARKRQQQGREDAQVAAPSTGRRRNDKGKRFKLSGANTMHAQEDKTGTTTDLTMPGELQAERERSGSSNWLSQPLRSNESPSEYEPSGRHRRKRPSKRKQKVSSQPQQPPTVPGQSTNIGELSIAEEPQPATEQPPNAVPLVSTRPVFSEKQPPREAKPKNFESPHNRPAMEKKVKKENPNLDLPPAAQHSAKIEDPTKNVIEKIQKLLEARESKEISEKIPEISSHKDLLPELKKTDELSGIDKPQQEGSIPSVEKDTKRRDVAQSHTVYGCAPAIQPDDEYHEDRPEKTTAGTTHVSEKEDRGVGLKDREVGLKDREVGLKDREVGLKDRKVSLAENGDDTSKHEINPVGRQADPTNRGKGNRYPNVYTTPRIRRRKMSNRAVVNQLNQNTGGANRAIAPCFYAASGHVNKPSREGFYCDVCKYIFDHKDIHLASIMHTQKVARQNSDTNGGQNDLKSTNRSHGHTRSQTHTYGGYYSQQPSVHEYHGFPSLPPTPTLLRREVPLRQQEDQYRTENYPIGLHYDLPIITAALVPEAGPVFSEWWSRTNSGYACRTPKNNSITYGQKSCFQRQWYPSTEQWQSQFIQPRSYTANLPYPASNYTPAMPQRWSCDICQVSVDAQNREAHLGSGFHRSRAAHRNKVIEVMQRPKPIQKLWTCKICKAVVAETEMANHLLGEQHSKVIIANLEAARSWKVPGAVLEPTQIVAPTPEPVPAAKEYVALEIKNGDGKEAGGGEKSAYGSEDDEFYGLVP